MTTIISNFDVTKDSESVSLIESSNPLCRERELWQTEEIRTQLVKLWMVTQRDSYTEIDCQISTLGNGQALTFILGKKRHGHYKSGELLKLLKFLEYIAYKPANEDSLFDSIEGTRFSEVPCCDNKQTSGLLERILNYVAVKKIV